MTGILPVISQVEVLLGIIVALVFLVAVGAATFVILALSKVLDILPIDSDVIDCVREKRN